MRRPKLGRLLWLTDEHAQKTATYFADVEEQLGDKEGGGESFWTKLLKSLPIAFVACLSFTIYCTYVLIHCIQLLQLGVPESRKNHFKYMRGVFEITIFNIGFVGFVYVYIKAIRTSPGHIPEGVEWDYDPKEQPVVGPRIHERTSAGDVRACKWCKKLKPDRCHHCRQCRTCVLRMDHHCPWTWNCVGYGNYKYFYLSVVYSTFLVDFVALTLLETVLHVVNEPTMAFEISAPVPFGILFMLLFGETLAVLLALTMTTFLSFHTWLLVRNMTTLEFCEKRRQSRLMGSMTWDRGTFRNLQDVLGWNPLLWLLPTAIDQDDDEAGVFFTLPDAEPNGDEKHRLLQEVDTSS